MIRVIVAKSQEDIEKYETARDIVRLATRTKCREYVLRMLLKDVANLNELLATL